MESGGTSHRCQRTPQKQIDHHPNQSEPQNLRISDERPKLVPRAKYLEPFHHQVQQKWETGLFEEAYCEAYRYVQIHFIHEDNKKGIQEGKRREEGWEKFIRYEI